MANTHTKIVYPIKNIQSVSEKNMLGMVSVSEAVSQKTQIEEIVFSEDKTLNAILVDLHDRILSGGAGLRLQVDRYVQLELLLRDTRTAKRLSCILGPGLYTHLRTDVQDTLHVNNLPDLGCHIRNVIFFSGNNPPSLQMPSCFVFITIYEALPNIKRTKMMKKSNSNFISNNADNCLVSASINVLLGTLLGLYGHASKFPPFPTRCNIVAQIRKLQCASIDKKQDWLWRHPYIVKICFMEYVLWFIENFLPVEYSIIHQRLCTDTYYKIYKGLCDSFRQNVSEIGPDIGKLEMSAQHHVERCFRICRFKMERHQQTPCSINTNPQNITKESIAAAMQSYHIKRSRLYTVKSKGRSGFCRDFSNETRLTQEVPDINNVTVIDHIHQMLHTSPLPHNIAQSQMRAINKKTRNCSKRMLSARSIHICIVCCLQHKPIGSYNLRYMVDTGTIQCTTCVNDWSVIRVQTFGYVMYYSTGAFFLCTFCASLTQNTVSLLQHLPWFYCIRY